MIKWCVKCGDEITLANTSLAKLAHHWNSWCRKCAQQADTERLVKNRHAVLDRLGSKCQCCGLSDHQFLSIDHIDGSGIKDRHSFSKWKNYIKHLLKMPLDELLSKYQCLCYNCNYTMGFWGKCSHQFSTEPIPENMLLVANHGQKYNHLSHEEYEERRLGIRRIIKLVNKLEMINAYGKCCIECKESHPLFLTLDHVNNNGNLEHKSGGSEFYQYLKGFGYPGNGTQLQLLCHNCNARKEYIERRQNKNVSILTTPEIYVKQPYEISKELKEQLQNQARRLYYLINH